MAKKILMLQENGRHLRNREFRECFCLQRAFRWLNVETVVWGKGHANYSIPFNDIVRDCDLVLSIENYDSGWHPDLSTEKRPKAFWCIDAHMGVERYVEFVKKNKFDVVYNSTSKFVDNFKDLTQTSEWLPNAYDHFLIDRLPHVQKKIELGFCGNIVNRGQFIQYLKEKYGLHHDRMVLGFDMVRAINSYKIHWNLNVSTDTNYRTFETLGCGTLLLTNYNDDLGMLFDIDSHLLYYKNKDDMDRTLTEALENPQTCNSIANNGYLHVRKNHTYLERAKKILELFGDNCDVPVKDNMISVRNNNFKFFSQYDEEIILWRFFKNKRRGFLVDVGAADGVRYSNSRYLIKFFDWNGILIEPHPEFQKHLHSIYAKSKNVHLCNYAVANKTQTSNFYMYGKDKHAQVSTLSDEFKQRVIHTHGDKYLEPIKVETMPLKKLLVEYNSPDKIDFMSIDCEGSDMEVLQSMDWVRFEVNLVCIEHSMDKTMLMEYMNSIGYSYYDETLGNSFFFKDNTISSSSLF